MESLIDYIFIILAIPAGFFLFLALFSWIVACLLYTSDAADE